MRDGYISIQLLWFRFSRDVIQIMPRWYYLQRCNHLWGENHFDLSVSGLHIRNYRRLLTVIGEHGFLHLQWEDYMINYVDFKNPYGNGTGW
ncbi:hypothetical protein QJS10_CPB12g00273 [Acorus calamus]|uniref:Uncharacterized protein n=1 Tax=Acorus calamus TaxID=4465 RepID=A0AAV9DMK7_ACOCL|nr:hypothetical protein QJS10_CPB12g00273 [Acorus calamus]